MGMIYDIANSLEANSSPIVKDTEFSMYALICSSICKNLSESEEFFSLDLQIVNQLIPHPQQR